jgi:hypothetical protein
VIIPLIKELLPLTPKFIEETPELPAPPAPTVMLYAVPAVSDAEPDTTPPAPPPPALPKPPPPPPAATRYETE